MGLGLALVICLLIFIVVGIAIVQGRLVANHWRRVVAAGDQSALDELLDQTFEGWRNSRPPRGTPPADWRALHTAAVVAADRDRARVSLLVDPDVQVVQGERVEVGTAEEVARRAAVRMVERLMYEVPYVSFQQVQVDVLREFRDEEGNVRTPCLLTTTVDRETAAWSDWEYGEVEELLSEWETRERAQGVDVDPDQIAIISVAEVESARAVAAEQQAVSVPHQHEDPRQ